MVLPSLTAALTAFSFAVGPDTLHCAAAARFLRDDRQMTVAVEADTIDDWRTGKHTPGCRITAAGGTNLTVQKEAVLFYERVRGAGWTRTPDPRDAPNEASLRFRQGNSDCLFNVNAQALLNTEAEQRVNDQLKLKDGQARYQVFVMCVPVAAAVAR